MYTCTHMQHLVCLERSLQIGFTLRHLLRLLGYLAH
jgi:hypothetical protein